MKIYLNFKLRMQWYHFVLPVDSPKAVAWKWFNLSDSTLAVGRHAHKLE